MSHDDLIALVLESRREDWLADDAKGIFTLRTDLDVTLREIDRDPDQWERFDEEWVRKFPDPVAYRQNFELWYRASYVKTYYFVSVDGARASLPLPKAHDQLVITREQLAIANIVNLPEFRDYFERYIRRFKFED